MARTFSELQESMSARAFCMFCIQIATEYAYSTTAHSESYFMDEYNITKGCYVRIKDYVVTHYLVNNQTVLKMKEKAKKNQARHTAYGDARTEKHYSVLQAERSKYCIWLMYDLMKSIFTVRDFFESHGIFDPRLYSPIMLEGLTAEGKFSISMIKAIQLKVMKECTTDSQMAWMCGFFGSIWEKRV